MSEMQVLAQQTIQASLDGREYNDGQTDEWCSGIISWILSELRGQFTPRYKFVASCMILSRRSQFVNETQLALWDMRQDLKITTKWANESMQCIVSIWAFRSRFG